MPSYPAALPGADAAVAGLNHGQVYDELYAALAELGTLPKGTYADVKSRLNQAGDIFLGDPRQHDLLAWTWDPLSGASSSGVLTTGLQYFHKVFVPRSVTFTNVWFATLSAGATLTAGANNLALYDSTGARIAATPDQTTNYTTTGLKTVAFSTPVAVTGGPTVFVWIGVKSTGTTPVGLQQLPPGFDLSLNANQTTANYRAMQNGTATGALMPASITLASNVLNAKAYWLALS